MSLFKKNKKEYTTSKFNGVLFLMTPLFQNVELGFSGNLKYEETFKTTLLKSLMHYVNNFLIKDEESNCFIQYQSINSNGFMDSFLKCDNFGSNNKYDGISEINRILFELDSKLEDISFDVLRMNKIKIPELINENDIVGHCNTSNENIEIPTNMNFKNKVYKQGFMFNENYHFNNRNNIIENFKNPLTNFENFISYVDDGSFNNEVFSNTAFNKIVDHIKIHIQQMINELDNIIESNVERFDEQLSNNHNYREILINLINKRETENENTINETQNKYYNCTPEKNNLILNSDLLTMFVDDFENWFIENEYDNLKTNLINLILLRCLNYIQPFAVIPLNSERFNQFRLNTNNSTIILKNCKDDNITVLKNSKIENDTEEDIPLLLNCNVNENSNEIDLSYKEGEETNEKLFKDAIKFIKDSRYC